MAKSNKILVAFFKSNGFSSSTLNQKDERAISLKLINIFRSGNKGLKSNENFPMFLEMSRKQFQMLLLLVVIICDQGRI